MKRKVAFKTLGCRLNQFETDSLVSQFHKGGYEIVEFSDQADVYVVNTCTVTNQSDHKSRNMISQAGHKPDSMVVVTGCMANHFKEKLESQEQITYVVPNEQKSSIYSLIDAHYRGEIIHAADASGNTFNFDVAEKSFHTRCMVKIQDGCDNFCTYCIIPMVRGRAISRPLTDITDNIRKALDLGYKEMVLTGVNISRYNHNNVNFSRLIKNILDIPGDFRLRISSIEPDGFDDEFFDLLQHPKFSPHLHLCLQSGSDKILLKMRRMYNMREFLSITGKVRSRIPSFNFTTDVIVGFPGETEEDFRETEKMVRETGFSHIHTFKYSVRDHTRAARMPEQVPEKIKNLRSEIIRAIDQENRQKYLESFIGNSQVLLTEKIRGNVARGYGEHYVPIEIHGEKLQPNQFYKANITGIIPGKELKLTGTIVK